MTDRHAWSSLGLWLLALLLYTGRLTAAEPQDADARRPVPSDAEQQAAMKLVEEVYGQELKERRSAKETATLAKRLLADGRASTEPANRFVVFKTAVGVAASAGDAATALQAVDQLDREFQIDALRMKLDVMQTAAGSAESSEQLLSLARSALKLVDEMAAEENYQQAVDLAAIALSAARKSRDRELVREVVARKLEVERDAKWFSEVEDARRTLQTQPTDPKANLVVGKYLCLVRGDWRRGIPMIALGDDPKLAELAEKELHEQIPPDEQLALADGWYEAAANFEGAWQRRVKGHAAYWYKQALPQLKTLAKLKAEKRLEEIGKEVSEAELADAAHAPAAAGAHLPAAQQPKLVRTRALGGRGGGAFEDVPNVPALLVGFNVTTSRFFAGHLTIKSVQPIYLTRAGVVPSKNFGRPHGKAKTITAKPGYAVGGIVAKSGLRVDGFRPVFMRVKGDKLDPNDSYDGPWVGGRGGGGETTLGGDGKPVVGIHGRRGADLDALGLIQLE